MSLIHCPLPPPLSLTDVNVCGRADDSDLQRWLMGPTYNYSSAGIRSGVGRVDGPVCPPDFSGWQIAGGGSTWLSGTGLTVECTGVIPDCCSAPFVSGDVTAGSMHPEKMGFYALVDGSTQAGRPVWRNSLGSLLYFTQARWHMGPRYDPCSLSLSLSLSVLRSFPLIPPIACVPAPPAKAHSPNLTLALDVRHATASGVAVDPVAIEIELKFALLLQHCACSLSQRACMQCACDRIRRDPVGAHGVLCTKGDTALRMRPT